MNFITRPIARRASVLLAVVGLYGFKSLPINAATVSAKRFPSASGAVKYRMTMTGKMALSGDITMTWANYGARFRQDSQMCMKMGARKTTMTTWALFDGKALYSAMPSGPGAATRRKVAMRMTLPPDYLKNMAMGGAPSSLGAGRVVGRGMALGKPCEIRTVDLKNPAYTGQVKMWLWQKMPLRTEMDIKVKEGKKTQTVKMSMVATQLNTNIKPNPALFRLPAGYQIQDMSAMQKQMMQRMQAQSKKPQR